MTRPSIPTPAAKAVDMATFGQAVDCIVKCLGVMA